MKFVIALFALSGIILVSAAPPGASEAAAEIVKYEEEPSIDGNYRYALDTDNGISIVNQGVLKPASSSDKSDAVVQSGSFSYVSPEGETIQVTYVADDEGGFQPQGSHLPTPPPVPPQIQKAVDYLLSLGPRS